MSVAECQAVCDVTHFCQAWSYAHSEDDKYYQRCQVKKEHGWLTKYNHNFYSGFKQQGPWYADNTKFTDGNYKCNQ